MRITIDMPTALMRAAKARAAEHGESLGDLVRRAVSREVGLPVTSGDKAGRVTLPLIARDAASAIFVSHDGISDAFDAEDIERFADQ
jgi:hypothetical protein